MGRRHFVKQTAAGLGALLVPGVSRSSEHTDKTFGKVVCVGGHPDDPESGCGGTLAMLASQGFDVTIIYLTTGEAGIEGKSHAEAAAIRKEEALKACKILGVSAVFAGQIDGKTIVDPAWIEKIHQLIEDVQPTMMFTHWPIDSHRDHQAASVMAIQSWWKSGQKYPLYFFEVSYGIQSVGFNPTDYFDITATQQQKRQALFCHTSQKPASIYAEGHEAMEKFRGMAIGVKAAEGFVRMQGSSSLVCDI